MKKKNVVFLIVVLIIVAAISGCELIDSILINAPDVKVADLDDYSGEAVGSPQNQASEIDVKNGFEYAMSLIDNQAIPSRVLGDNYNEVVDVLDKSMPIAARIIETEPVESRSYTVGVNASIKDEVYSENDIDITVNNISFSADVEMDEIDEPTTMAVEFDADADVEIGQMSGEVSIDEEPYYLDVIVENTKFNAIAKGSSNVDLDEYGDPESIQYDVVLDLSLGFSLTCDGYSGKYTVSLHYDQAATLSEDDLENDVFTSEENLNVDVFVFNNDGDMIGSATYTAEEFVQVLM